jgi:hypothetical protein
MKVTINVVKRKHLDLTQSLEAMVAKVNSMI